jgi:hypothetical protein
LGGRAVGWLLEEVQDWLQTELTQVVKVSLIGSTRKVSHLVQKRRQSDNGVNMKGRGPKCECGTITILNEQSEEAMIWTASQIIYRRLLKRLGSGWLVKDEERSARV